MGRDRRVVALGATMLALAALLALVLSGSAPSERTERNRTLPVAVSKSDSPVVSPDASRVQVKSRSVPGPSQPELPSPPDTEIAAIEATSPQTTAPVEPPASPAPLPLGTTLPAVVGAAPWAEQALGLMNQARKARGLQALVLDSALMSSAESHNVWMTSNFLLCHSHTCNPSASPTGFAVWAENIGWTGHNDIGELHRAFLDSPKHRRNVEDPRFTRVGIGYGQGTVPGGSAWFMTVQFAE